MNTLHIEHPFELPADDWFHIAPIGEFDHASGVRQVIDEAACRAMTEHFNEDAAAPNFPGLLIDFDHFSHSADKTSAAAGWIIALRAEPAESQIQNSGEHREPASRCSGTLQSQISNLKSEIPGAHAPGLWARIRWSDLGEASVRGGRYRLVSPVWNRHDCELVATENGMEKVRPLRLSRVALTNDPNLKGLVPLTNRVEEKTTTNMDYKQKLTELLHLPVDANDEQIIDAAAAWLQEAQTLQQRYGALLSARVEDDLREFADVIGDVETVKSQLLANRDGTLSLLRALRPSEIIPVDRIVTPRELRPALHNRLTANVPDAVVSPDKNAGEESRARRIANRAREIQKQLGLGHTQAFQLARGEIEKA